MSEQPRQGAECDLYRDTWVRYLGERWSEIRSDPTTLGKWLWHVDLESKGKGLVLTRLWQETGLRRGLGTCPRSHNTLFIGLCWRRKPSGWVAMCHDRALAVGLEDLNSYRLPLPGSS